MSSIRNTILHVKYDSDTFKKHRGEHLKYAWVRFTKIHAEDPNFCSEVIMVNVNF